MVGSISEVGQAVFPPKSHYILLYLVALLCYCKTQINDGVDRLG